MSSDVPEQSAQLSSEHLAEELLDAFVRLARGDMTVRMPRSYKRDNTDTLAYFVNLIAEELGRLLSDSEKTRKRLEQGVLELNELFLRLAAGDFSVRSSRTGQGDPLDVLGFLFDNTVAEVGEAFTEVDRQRATLEAIFDSMADAVFLLDSSGSVARANDTACRLFDRSVHVLERSSFIDLLSPRDQAFGRWLTNEGLTKSFRSRDTYFVDTEGETFSLVLSGTPLFEPGGKPRGIVLTGRDERELRQAQTQLQLSDRLATMGTLAAGVAHEINNPLSFVISNLEFVLEELDILAPGQVMTDELRDELIRALRTSKEGAERVAKIVRDLKSISRVDQDTGAQVDIISVLDSASVMLKNEIRHRARLIKDYGTTPFVFGSEARFMQIALNLLQNAAQAIPIGRVADNFIRIETSTADNGDAVIAITDSGSGIPPDRLEAIFDPFFTTKPVGVGTGLGLSICKRLVGQLGGTIDVESTVGTGTTFRVCLPGLPIPKDTLDKSRATTAREVPSRRVLVVDDERQIGESVQRLLGSRHEVDVAESGREALILFGNKDYDLVLIDIMMPEMSGKEVRSALMAQYPDHEATVVLMSGGTMGADDDDTVRIEKPFAPTVLRNLVASLDPARLHRR